jgi:trk system potassium uptake protein TrkA
MKLYILKKKTAERWAKKLCIKGVVDSFELNGEYSIVEVNVPPIYVGRTLGEIGFRKNHNVVVLTTIKITKENNLIGQASNVTKVKGVASQQTRLEEGDIMVIYGSNKDIRKLLEII